MGLDLISGLPRTIGRGSFNEWPWAELLDDHGSDRGLWPMTLAQDYGQGRYYYYYHYDYYYYYYLRRDQSAD